MKKFNSFLYALQGIMYCIKNERHMAFHLFAAALAVILGFYCKINLIEWCVLSLTITLVIITEMINTAVERTVDMITDKYHPLAKLAKNVAAGAVLVAALNSLIIGAVIFLM